jgi:hypothetical protein
LKKIIRLFIDLDGTICGQTKWMGWYNSTKALFNSGLLMRIPNVCWSILTARPRIDKFIISRICKKYKIYPKKIIVSPTWFFSFKNNDEIADWKTSILSKSLDELFVDKVIYVDTSFDLLSRMIKQKDIILCHPDILENILKEEV